MVTVLAPDGTDFDDEYVTSYTDPAQGSFNVQLCDWNMPGRYTVTGAGTWGTVSDPWAPAPSTFVVRRAMTRTTLKAAPLGGGRYRLTVVVRDERPKGYYPTEAASGVLEEFKGGRWVHVRGATYVVDQHGRASGVERVISSRVRVRALTKPDFGYSGSTSRPVTLRR